MTTRRRSNIRPAGFAYIFLTLLVSLGAFNSQNNLLFLAFGFSLSLLVVSGMISGVMLMGLRIRRETPPVMRVGEASHVTYHLRSTNRLVPAFAIRIAELDPQGIEPVPQAGQPAKRAKKRSRHAPLEASGFLPHLAPRETGVVEVSCLPTRRGMLTLPGVVIESSFPFGLLDKRIEYSLPTRVLVRPRRVALEPSLIARLVRTRGNGGNSSRSHSVRSRASRGGGDEFYALSAYRPGDEWRRIAWRASARSDAATAHGGLLVRENIEQPPTKLWVELLLGRHVSEAQDELAISLCASIIEDAARQHIDAGLSIPVAGVLLAPKGTGGGSGGRGGRRHIESMLDALAAIDLSSLGGRDVRPGHGNTKGTTVVVNAGPIGSAVASEQRGTVVIDAGRYGQRTSGEGSGA